jgi:hypothetical protein
LSSFPPPGQIVAGILSGDTAGQTKFASMQAGIPNIQPKVSAFRGLLVLVWHLKLVSIVVSKHPINAFSQGTGGVLNPNISYSPTDPDCWWTFGQCTTPKTPGVKADIASVPEVSLIIYIYIFFGEELG